MGRMWGMSCPECRADSRDRLAAGSWDDVAGGGAAPPMEEMSGAMGSWLSPLGRPELCSGCSEDSAECIAGGSRGCCDGAGNGGTCLAGYMDGVGSEADSSSAAEPSAETPPRGPIRAPAEAVAGGGGSRGLDVAAAALLLPKPPGAPGRA